MRNSEYYNHRLNYDYNFQWPLCPSKHIHFQCVPNIFTETMNALPIFSLSHNYCATRARQIIEQPSIHAKLSMKSMQEIHKTNILMLLRRWGDIIQWGAGHAGERVNQRYLTSAALTWRSPKMAAGELGRGREIGGWERKWVEGKFPQLNWLSFQPSPIRVISLLEHRHHW